MTAPRTNPHVTRDPPVRRFTVDVGAAAARRHVIPAWFAADITEIRPLLDARPDTGSLTTYVVATLARAVRRHPRMHAMRDLRGRVVTFRSVDVNVMVEVLHHGRPFPMNHVLRSADTRGLHDLYRELQAVKVEPSRSETRRLAAGARWFLLLPSPVRSRAIGALHRFPDRQRSMIGTVGVTSVGMFGQGGGLGLPFLVHTLDILVGGVEERPGFNRRGEVVPRQFLQIAVVADHDVVDGAPLARFLSDFRRGLESGAALPSRPEGTGTVGA